MFFGGPSEIVKEKAPPSYQSSQQALSHFSNTKMKKAISKVMILGSENNLIEREQRMQTLNETPTIQISSDID